jgi:hypothetical protein
LRAPRVRARTAEIWDPSQWRCFGGGHTTTSSAGAGNCAVPTCQRSHDGTGVDLQTCQEGCGPPLCGTAPCQNGGTCAVLPPSTAAAGSHRLLFAGAGTSTCNLADMTQHTAEVNRECCGTDDGICHGGVPTSCDSGCASVFLPFWQQCGAAFPDHGAQFQSVVTLCEARARGYSCSCAAGWSGANCAQPALPSPPPPPPAPPPNDPCLDSRCYCQYGQIQDRLGTTSYCRGCLCT